VKKLFAVLFFSTILLWAHGKSFGATCSCAGVPLLASIDTSATEKGQFFLAYTTEYHQISDLVSGSRDVNDETGRDRNTVSHVLSASYALSDRWALSALVSHVDPLFMTPFSRHELSLGAGLRIPTGEDNFGSGFVLSEDMQPSTGAAGKIFWASYGYAFNQAATVQLNASLNYMVSEENDRNYAFGEEFNFALGISQSIGTRFGYSAALRYRSTQADERAGAMIPNTGGEWLDFAPAVQFSLSDKLKLALSGRVPVSRNLDGALQFTTSYSYALSLTYGF
jgi:hypothetical protein